MLDHSYSESIWQRINQKTKPLGALGQLETLAHQLALIQSNIKGDVVTDIKICQPTAVVFAGDHGIADEGVSIAPSAVTQQMVGGFLAAAESKTLVLVDGFIVSAAAYAASMLNPDCREIMIFAHQSHEAGHQYLLKQLASLLARFEFGDVVLIDCLTLWLNNIIYNHGQTLSEEQIKRHVSELHQAIVSCKADVILVSNEVGLGVVPLGEVSRLFVDHAGWMNQALAQVAHRVTLIAAGLPMTLKQVDGA